MVDLKVLAALNPPDWHGCEVEHSRHGKEFKQLSIDSNLREYRRHIPPELAIDRKCLFG